MWDPSIFLYRNPKSLCDSIRRWGLWEVEGGSEGGGITNGISALIMKTPESAFSLPLCEDSEATVHESGSMAFTRQ